MLAVKVGFSIDPSSTPDGAGNALLVTALRLTGSCCGGVEASDEVEPDSLPREEKVRDTGEEFAVVDCDDESRECMWASL